MYTSDPRDSKSQAIFLGGYGPIHSKSLQVRSGNFQTFVSFIAFTELIS